MSRTVRSKLKKLDHVCACRGGGGALHRERLGQGTCTKEQRRVEALGPWFILGPGPCTGRGLGPGACTGRGRMKYCGQELCQRWWRRPQQQQVGDLLCQDRSHNCCYLKRVQIYSSWSHGTLSPYLTWIIKSYPKLWLNTWCCQR